MKKIQKRKDGPIVTEAEITAYTAMGATYDPPAMYCTPAEGIPLEGIDLEIQRFEVGRRIHAGKQVHAYICDRAKAEGVPFDLEEELFVTLVLRGVESFFGVTLSDCGVSFGIEDEQQPRRGFLTRWIKRNGGAVNVPANVP